MFNERQLRIISLLQSQEKVSVSELTAEFGVSLVTVRQDLKKLEDQGVLKRTHGGAVAVDNGYDTSTRMWNNYEKKQRIVQRAAGLVSDGETIIIETGSTCSLLARELATKRGITIITNSWVLVNYFRSNSRVTLILAPGEYKENQAGVISDMTMRFFETFNVDKTFLGTQGLELERGATVADFTECNIKRTMLQAGKVKILLADHNKLGQTFLVKQADVDEFDYIVTDNQSDPTYLQRIRDLGVTVYVAE